MRRKLLNGAMGPVMVSRVSGCVPRPTVHGVTQAWEWFSSSGASFQRGRYSAGQPRGDWMTEGRVQPFSPCPATTLEARSDARARILIAGNSLILISLATLIFGATVRARGSEGVQRA